MGQFVVYNKIKKKRKIYNNFLLTQKLIKIIENGCLIDIYK